MRIPFNSPYIDGNEIENIIQALKNKKLSGDGDFTKKCQKWLETNCQVIKAYLTHSCTAALEMAALLIDIKPGDEVIMPSYTFVSTANAFVLRGAVPVFVDIRKDTLNINEELIESAITNKTKAIVPVHYAGVACEMDRIMQIAQKHNLYVIEDAAQGILASYKNRPLGSIGHFGCLSFHDTKNIISGEGGCLLINDNRFIHKAEIIREKGTNRGEFSRGKTDKYTWVDLGSSFLPSEITAAFLLAQLTKANSINEKRLDVWRSYHNALVKTPGIKRPQPPNYCKHNAHIYYILTESEISRSELMKRLNDQDIQTAFHYIPLHSSPFGKTVSKQGSTMSVTNEISQTILRLPLWPGVDSEKVISAIKTTLSPP